MNSKMAALAMAALLGWSGSKTQAPTGFQTDPALQQLNTVPMLVDGLRETVQVIEDADGIPHVYARNDHDANFMLGYLHARDRLFQMDMLRRIFSGTLAELLGTASLSSDIQFRTLGLRIAAERSLSVYSPYALEQFQAYSEGVNAWLGAASSLPGEYAALELTQVAQWTPLDTVTVAKGLAFGLSFDIDDIDRTETLAEYQASGQANGFDGTALFFDDLFRSAPFDPTVAIEGEMSKARSSAGAFNPAKATVSPRTRRLVRKYLERLAETPGLRDLLSARRRQAGSNFWAISGQHTQSGNPLIANDPHLSLDSPSIFYEAHVVVTNDPGRGPMNVNGVTFPGAPAFAQGCNERICWGSTVNPMDVTDVFQEEIVTDITGLFPVATVFGEGQEPLESRVEFYRANDPASGISDDVDLVPVDPLSGGFILTVPRRNNGPIVSISFEEEDVFGLSVQYTGWGPTREVDAFFRMARSSSVQDFREALQYFDVGSQNWAYADVDGNIAYFTSAEMPIREDLQQGVVDGLPPYFVRDGTHVQQNEWMPIENPQPQQAVPYEILPFGEMPQIVNPASGVIISANSDPIGTTLDNNALNQLRPGGGIYYLSPGYSSLRAGQIGRLIDAKLQGGGGFTLQDMKLIQQNNQLLDAQVFVPYLLEAFDDSVQGSTNQGLTGDQRVVEAINRLRSWDFSTPTGIAEGFDPDDDPANLPQPAQDEIDHSIAATIFAVFRERILDRVFDQTLTNVGLPFALPDSERAVAALRHLLDDFASSQGIGSSGLDFFDCQAFDTRAECRDFRLLDALSQALDLLASDDFAAAFDHSTDQDDYRWGRLHRITFDHPLGGVFGIPQGAGFSDLEPGLPGIARSGGFGVVDASSHSAFADSANEFGFGSGPARRFIGRMTPDGIEARQIIPGGQSGIAGTAHFGDQLGRWLTNNYHEVRLTREAVEGAMADETLFRPSTYMAYFPYYEGDQNSFSGYAAANLAQGGSELTFTARDEEGSTAGFPNNPDSIALESETQQARLGHEIFGFNVSDTQSGWVELGMQPPDGTAPPAPFVASFILFGDFPQTRLDGTPAIRNGSSRLLFTRVHQGAGTFRGLDAQTRIFLGNPNDGSITLDLALVLPPNPAALRLSAPQTAEITIAPRGRFRGSIEDLFAGVSVDQGYLTAVVRDGLSAVGMMELSVENQRSLVALNAQYGNGTTRLVSPQLAFTPEIFSSINLINAGEFERTATLMGVPQEGGPPIAFDPIQLAPGEQIVLDAEELFAGGGKTRGQTTTFVGSLIVEASGEGLIGDVVLGAPDDLGFAVASPLQSAPFTQAVFGQVANAADFFTGLALFNPNDETAQITIEVLAGDGAAVGSEAIELAPGGRLSRTLVELVPSTEGQAGGQIRVISDQPIFGQEIFGTGNLSLQSAVAPTVVN